jgi:hypothetical protein
LPIFCAICHNTSTQKHHSYIPQNDAIAQRLYYTTSIVSDAVAGIIDGGEITATEVHVKKHLQLGTSMPLLTSARTDYGAKLLVEAKSTVPQLRKIQNAGSAKILSATPELADLQNAASGHLQLESSAPDECFSNLRSPVVNPAMELRS